jgi:hypothetical protein
MKVKDVVREDVPMPGQAQPNPSGQPQTGKVSKVQPGVGGAPGMISITKPDGSILTVPSNQITTGIDGKMSVNTQQGQPGQNGSTQPAPTANGQPQVTMGQDLKMQEEPSSPGYPVDTKSGKPMALAGGRGPTAIVPSKLWTAITPEVELKACGDGKGSGGQGFRKVMLQFNGKQIPGLEGGDQQLGSKIIVAPSDYQLMSTPVRESDDELARWKSIAGL